MALDREDCFHSQYYDYIRRLYTILGLWPSLKRSRRLFCAVVITLLLLVGINSQIYLILILMFESKTQVITESLQTLLPTIAFAAGYWNLLYNFALINKILDRLRHNWNQVNNEEDMSIMEAYATQSKIATYALAWSIVLYILFLISPTIIRFILYNFGIIDMSKVTLLVYHENFVPNKFMYYFSVLMQLSIMLTAYVAGITHYSLFITLLQHSCALFLIVTNEIEQPFKKDEYKSSCMQTVTRHDGEFEWMVSIIGKYNNAINFFELIKSLYGQMYIVELAIGFIFIVIDFVYFFQLRSLTLTTGEVFKIGLFINGTFMMIYAYVFLGERLMEHSTSVNAKCLTVPFYDLSNQTNKLLLLLIMRSMKPCHLSLNGVAVMSHELFAKIMKASFSFVSVFYNAR